MGHVQLNEGQLKTELGQKSGAQLNVGAVLGQIGGGEVTKIQIGHAQFHGWTFSGVQIFIHEIGQDVLHGLRQLLDHVEQAELHVAVFGVLVVDLDRKYRQAQLIGDHLNHIGQGQQLVNLQAHQTGRNAWVVQAHLGGHGLDHVQELVDKRNARTDVRQLQLGHGDDHHIIRIGAGLDEGLHQLEHTGRQDFRQAELHQAGGQQTQWNLLVNLDTQHLAAEAGVVDLVLIRDDLDQGAEGGVDRIQVGQVDFQGIIARRVQPAAEHLGVDVFTFGERLDGGIQVQSGQSRLADRQVGIDVIGVGIGCGVAQRGAKTDGQLFAQNRRFE